MIAEQQLKSDCTPEIVKKMVELAEGFEFISDGNNIHIVRLHLAQYEHEDWILRLPLFHRILFPLLIHRAVEGWNKKEESILKEIIVYNDSVKLIEYKKSREGGFDPFAIVIKKFENYQPSSLTPCECACLHCLIEVLK